MLRLFTLLGLLCFAGLSQAADNGFYLGVGAVDSEYNLDNPGDAEPFDDSDNGFKVIVGFRPLEHFGVEANYIDHGDAVVPAGIACLEFFTDPCPAATNLSATTTSVFAVGYLPLPVIDLFAKVGATSWQFEGSSPGFPGFDIDDDDVEFAYGVGIQARFGSLGVRAEYERFPIIEDEELGTISVSFTYTFL